MLRQQLGALIVGTSMLACGAAFAQAAPATRDAIPGLTAEEREQVSSRTALSLLGEG